MLGWGEPAGTATFGAGGTSAAAVWVARVKPTIVVASAVRSLPITLLPS
jgi:hypothetical protein